MQTHDGDDTVIRARPGQDPGGAADPHDLEADTIIRARPADLDEAPARPEPLPLPEPGELRERSAAEVPHVLVEPPRVPLRFEERPVAARAGVVNDPVPFTVPWHRIRVNRQEPIPLDAPALIGRKPVLPRITIAPVPRLVWVPSPGQEVSSTHIELRQQGSTVIVTDLRSTNGTVVKIPGASVQKLRQGESLVVSAGTIVDIGDGNTVEILPIERVV